MKGTATVIGRWVAIALLLVLLPSAVFAQANPTLTEAERGIGRDGDAEARRLRIDQMTVAAHVVGRTATVTLDLLIESDSNDRYEAKLSLLLPTDAVVTGYALDVGGRMIPGQLLEQPRARNLYEDEVRKGIDPGLAEVNAGNRFATRIFPIDASHPRRFRVSFAAPFDPAIGLLLPLARDAALGRVAMSVTIDGYARPPRVGFNDATVALTRTPGGWTGAATLRNAMLRGGLAIDGGEPAATMVVTRHASGERFFTIADQAPVTTGPVRGGRLRIYWDRSRSRRDDPIRLEADTLARLVDLTAPAAIDLVTFASDQPGVVAVRDGVALRATLDRLTYRGATSFAGLDALVLPEASACVLVSDGQVTIDRAAGFAPDCAVTILTAATGADGARLGRMARGGAVVRVGEGRTAQAAAALA
ncbi:MAG: hypothetical protein JWN21_1226, partial [Sphingomonas bacterium]|uniref:VIT domain-containing protein n=1 Tax=Sphingomonas bacterium TaxID=1895847 RepID=UPI002626DE24